MGALNAQYSDGGRIPEGVGLLISILLRYPEVGSIYYWREKHALQFTFMINEFEKELSFSFNKKLIPALEVFHKLERQEMGICDIEYRDAEKICVMTITRDVDSMTQREVDLIINIVKTEFINHLVIEEVELPEEELQFQEELIGHLLATIRTSDIDKNVVAVREEGRVIVFNN